MGVRRRLVLATIPLAMALFSTPACAQILPRLRNPFEEKNATSYEVSFAEGAAVTEEMLSLLRRVAANAKGGNPSNVTFQLTGTDSAAILRARNRANDLLRQTLLENGYSGKIAVVSGNPNADVIPDAPALSEWPLVRVRFKSENFWM